MTRTVKPATVAKNIMLEFLAANGYGLRSIETTEYNVHYHVIGKNSLHYGQITITHPELGTWIADYNKAGKLKTPRNVVQLPTGGWVSPAMYKRIEEEREAHSKLYW